MQKQFITFAIVALISFTEIEAIAQTDAKLYGVVDYGYTFHHDRNEIGKFLEISKTNSRFNSGQSAGNRIGFKGVEDLGNGIKAIFVLERGFALDTGEDAKSFNRQAYVALSGNYGTISGGLVYTPYYRYVSSLDPFADGSLKRDVVGGTIFYPVRTANTIAYDSPNFKNFKISAAFSNNAFSDDNPIKNSNNTTLLGISGTYTATNWNIGLSYHHIAVGNNENGIKNASNITFGGAYDFKVVKVSAFASYDKLNLIDDLIIFGKNSITQTNFMLGAIIPLGKHNITSHFYYSHTNKNLFGNALQVIIGYDYNFSSRTNFYAAYSYIYADKGRYSVSDTFDFTGAGYKQALYIGIKHSF